MNPVDYLYVSRSPHVIIENSPHNYTFFRNGKTYGHCRRLIDVEKTFGSNAFVFCTTYIDGKTIIWETYFQKNETYYTIEVFVNNESCDIIFYFYEFDKKEFLEIDHAPFEEEKERLVSLIIEHPTHRLFFATGDVKIHF